MRHGRHHLSIEDDSKGFLSIRPLLFTKNTPAEAGVFFMAEREGFEPSRAVTPLGD